MKLTVCILVLMVIMGCSSQTEKLSLTPQKGKAIAVFASGCFWCSEHVFEAIVGVEEVVSGYSGGTVKNPYYEYVSSNRTGHAESVAVFYDPRVVSYKELVAIFLHHMIPQHLISKDLIEDLRTDQLLFIQMQKRKK